MTLAAARARKQQMPPLIASGGNASRGSDRQPTKKSGEPFDGSPKSCSRLSSPTRSYGVGASAEASAELVAFESVAEADSVDWLFEGQFSHSQPVAKTPRPNSRTREAIFLIWDYSQFEECCGQVVAQVVMVTRFPSQRPERPADVHMTHCWRKKAASTWDAAVLIQTQN